MKEDSYSLLPGTLLMQGKYRIESVLGSGGFGITYRARHTGLEKDVAIKEFFMRGACDRESGSTHVTTTQSNRELATRFRNKFIKEARFIASLSHPNIVRVSDIFEENGTAYYVMEYIEGESLAQYVKRSGRLTEQEALDFIRQTGKALEYIHDRHMLHMDIKPGNILLQPATKSIVLIDFGVAKQYDSAGEQTSTTPPAVSNGYSPIEQYGQGQGVTNFTPATDVYALAATLYKLLTGITPPQSTELLGGETPLPPYPAGISQAVKDAIARSLQTRKARPQSVAEFLSLLDASPKEDEETLIAGTGKEQKVTKTGTGKSLSSQPQASKDNSRPLKIAVGILAAVVCIGAGILLSRGCSNTEEPVATDTIPAQDTLAPTATQEAPVPTSQSESRQQSSGHATRQEQAPPASVQTATTRRENEQRPASEAQETKPQKAEEATTTRREEEAEKPAKTDKDQVFVIAEEMPEFPGGEIGLTNFLKHNIRYPNMARINRIQGTVIVWFVIDEFGVPCNFNVIRSVSPELDKEAVRVLNRMPRWKPGRQSGEAVKVSYVVPIRFSLN